MSEITDQIILARTRYIKDNTAKPTRCILDMKGMHDLYEWFRDNRVRIIETNGYAGPMFLGLRIEFDAFAFSPIVR